MKPQLILLCALASVSLVTTAFAGAPATIKVKTPEAASTMHSPMTPQETHDLWQSAQTKLKADHLYGGPINGERNDQTQQAIRTFQSRHRLPETGNLDHATRQALGI